MFTLTLDAEERELLREGILHLLWGKHDKAARAMLERLELAPCDQPTEGGAP